MDFLSGGSLAVPDEDAEKLKVSIFSLIQKYKNYL